jgi:putative hydroxymethylpyrimidine transport system permease protein
MLIFRSTILILGLLLLWQLIVWLFQLPPYILPTPIDVIKTCIEQAPLLLQQAWPTLVETLLGLLFGSLIGAFTALSMAYLQPVRFWLFPILVISQAIPTFAIAPLLVIWFGYGMASKIVTTMLMLFFPVTSAFFDGLRHTPSGWLDLANTMGGSRWRILWHIRVPAALPNLASGLRVATAVAPIGAIVGEWVGSSRGLGFLMLNANARMQINVMFAALLMIILLSLGLYFIIDKLLRLAISWHSPQTHGGF